MRSWVFSHFASNQTESYAIVKKRIVEMTRNGLGGGSVFADRNSLPRQKFGNLLQSEPNIFSPIHGGGDDGDFSPNLESRASSAASPGNYYYYDGGGGGRSSAEATSPFLLSPWNNTLASSPYTKSPWIVKSPPMNPFDENNLPKNGLIGSIFREEGHIYSLASSKDLLYTGSESKNIRVWKDLKEYSGFKSSSGLVKCIVISNGKIFTGHQDGKIRIWKISSKDSTVYRRIGNLPTTRDFFKSSMNPRNYVEVRRNQKSLKIKHYDAVSCLSLDSNKRFLYSGSWDKTLKVWRMSDFKCIESITAHDDAINAVVAGFDDLVFTGSADGTVRVWRRRELLQGKKNKAMRHFMVQLLLKQEYAVTSLAVNECSGAVYCGSSDGLVNYWEKEGKERFSHGGVLRGHKFAVLCLVTAGKLVFSGSADKSICVWQREDDAAVGGSGGGGIHSCLSVLTGHDGPVKCLTVEEEEGEVGLYSERRWTVYSGSLDKSVKVWRVVEESPEFQKYALPSKLPEFGQNNRKNC